MGFSADSYNRPSSRAEIEGLDGLSQSSVRRGSDIFIAIIDRREFIRECIARCLSDVFGAERVHTYLSLNDWEKDTSYPNENAIILLCGDRNGAVSETRSCGRDQGGVKLPPVIVVSDSENAGEIVAALDGGAKGYIPTTVTLDVAVEAIRLVKAGGIFVPASSLMSARGRLAPLSSVERLCATGLFTARQAAVVQALRQGKANKVIAYELNMQESTVKVHVRNIMKKLKARNRTEVAYLTQHLFDR